MLRLLILVLVLYLVIRISLRLLLTESPAQRRARMNNRHNPAQRTDGRSPDGTSRFDHIEEAEFEEIPRASSDKKQ